MNDTKLPRIGVIIVLLLTLLLIFELTGVRNQIDIAFLRSAFESNIVSGTLIFMATFAVGNLIQLPGWIFLVAAVATLGKVNGGLLTYLAAINACIFSFYFVRVIGSDALRELKSPIAIKLLKELELHPVRNIILLRIFFQTLPVLNYSLGLSGVKFRHFLSGTLIGLPFPITIYCFFFDFLIDHLGTVSSGF